MKKIFSDKFKFTASLLNAGLVYRLLLVVGILAFMWASIFLVLR